MFGGAEQDEPAFLMAGHIGAVTVPHLIQLSENLRFPVWLRLDRQVERIELLVHGQHILLIRQHNLPEVFRLGRFLVELGAVDGPTINRLMLGSPRPSELIGQHLTDRGIVFPHQVQKALQRQVEELTCEAITWTQGRFSVTRCAPIPAEALRPEDAVHTTAVILEGMRRMEDWTDDEFLEPIPSMLFLPRDKTN